MQIEALKISNPKNTETSTSKANSSDKNFSKILSKANDSISTKEKSENTNNDSSNKVPSKKQKVETVDDKDSQATKEVEDTEKSKESEATSNRFKYDFSKGLEGLLGSVSKLIDNSDEDQKISLDDLSAILNASSVQQLGDLLGLDLKSDATDGLSLNKILQALGIDHEDVQNAIQQLTGDDHSIGKDVWDLLAGIGQNQQAFMQNLQAAIKGDSNAKVSKSQASQILQVLKLIELTAPKADLMLKQEYQTFQLKEMLSDLSSKLEATPSTSNETELANVNKVKQLNVKLVDAATSENISSIQTTTNKATTTAVTITLPTSKAAQAEAFVKEFQAIMNRSQFSNNIAGTKLLIKLYPENLGSIRVELIQKDGIMTARFLASTNIGKQMLESQLQQLKQGLVNQNIQLDRIDVAQTLTETNRNAKEHQQQFQHAFKQHSEEQQKQQKDNDEEQSDFNDILMDMEV